MSNHDLNDNHNHTQNPELLTPIEKLRYLMARLREPDGGCPWDLKQSYASIAPSTIEEAYEVVDAIEKGDFAHLREELGDLLFQVVFYAQLGAEDKHFDFDDIANAITDKLLRRHPHVFPDGHLASRVVASDIKTEADVKGQWEKIKASERREKGHTAHLADIPTGLPALARAEKLQKRAAMVGFDWPELAPVLAKLNEEVGELQTAIAAQSQAEIAAELGDCLFALVNVARHLKIDPETALRGTNQRFSARFHYIEQALWQQQRTLQEASLAEMDALWNQAKDQERSEPAKE